MINRIGQAIRENRNAPIVRGLARAAEKFLRAYHNEAFYDFSRNGERWVIERLVSVIGEGPHRIWDVGANHGQWAVEAHAVAPSARITSFEIIPSVAHEIAGKAAKTDWWTVIKKGASDVSGTTQVTWNHDNDDTSAVAPALNGTWFASATTQRIDCPVVALDDFWAETGERPRLLKIDVEGHEASVLAGADRLLNSADRPDLIQFEYGDTWVPARQMLGPVVERLETAGYAVGRLFPRHVDFRPFVPRDEHFRMGNMVAVADPALKEALSR